MKFIKKIRHWRILLIFSIFLIGCQTERTTMDNGLIIEIISKGDGVAAENYSIVTVHYTGTL